MGGTEGTRAIYRKCAICMEARDHTEVVGGHWEDECSFLFCVDCLVSYVTIKIREYTVVARAEPITILCPGPGCLYELSDGDIVNLCQADVYGSYLKALAMSHVPRHKDASGDIDEHTHRYIKESKIRRCPTCHILTEKNSGCEQVECVCGEEWCYSCGQANYHTHTCIACTRCNNPRAGHTANECPLSRCLKCGGFGHAPSVCDYYVPRCTRCQEWNHKSADCKAPKCTKCQAIGHLAANCAAPKCAKCGKRGHVTKKCPANRCMRCLGYGHTAKGCKKNAVCMVCESEDCLCDDWAREDEWEGCDVDRYGRPVHS